MINSVGGVAVPKPGGYQRDAGFLFGTGVNLALCSQCRQRPLVYEASKPGSAICQRCVGKRRPRTPNYHFG